ncbi:hypothetical protein E2C01_037241 [Portunus trituberculatus]|uniref:Uncharacterized protein n=1 Tax=Portunus trituberculatus TaxID=210409 RepID=A0A5B7F8U9_PORTR|nr:hypothetical protein [Portunus trituberculatus]
MNTRGGAASRQLVCCGPSPNKGGRGGVVVQFSRELATSPLSGSRGCPLLDEANYLTRRRQCNRPVPSWRLERVGGGTRNIVHKTLRLGTPRPLLLPTHCRPYFECPQDVSGRREHTP